MTERAVAAIEQLETQLQVFRALREGYCDQIAMLVHDDPNSAGDVPSLVRLLVDVQATIQAFEAVIADRKSGRKSSYTLDNL